MQLHVSVRRLSGVVPPFLGSLMLAVAGPVLAGEQELEQAPAPGAAQEITSPLERTFAAPARKQSLFPSITKALDELPPFLADTEFEARFRTYYLRKDRTLDELSEAWAMGGSVHYQSGWLADSFALEAELFTSQPIVADEDRGDSFLLEPVQEGYTVVGVANAKLRHSGVVLTGYRQVLSLPYVNRNDSRMTPNTFEALTIAKDEGTFRFSTGYVWRIKRRNQDEFVDMAEAVGVDRERGLAYLGLLYQPGDHFHVGASVGVVPDVLMGLYSEAVYAASVTQNVEVRAEGQLTYQQTLGKQLLAVDPFQTWNLGVRFSTSWQGWVARLGASLTSDQNFILSPYGSNPSYVDLMQRTFNRADEKALLVSLSYDFGQIGAPGLSTILNFVQGWQGVVLEGPREATEIDLTVDYRVPARYRIFEGLWLRVRGSWLHVEGRNQDGSDVRVILRYEFPIL
jgi:hypothetical protein